MSKTEKKALADHIEVKAELKVSWRNGTNGGLLHQFGGRASKNIECATLRLAPEPLAFVLVSQALVQHMIQAVGTQIQQTADVSAKIVQDIPSGLVDVHTDESVKETSAAPPTERKIIIAH